jgi:hypothetical protein
MPPTANEHTGTIIGSSECVFESKPSTTITDFIKMTQPPLRTRTRKSVSWAPMALVYSIPHINDMSNEDIKTIWYAPKDYKAFKKECRESARILAMEGLLLDSNSPMTASFCVRGLEQIVDKQVGSLRRLRRKNMRCIVLEEQRGQLATGIYDPETYEELCSEISATAHRQAHMKAMQDYEEVLEQKSKDDRKQAAALPKQTSSRRCALTAGASGSLKRFFAATLV